MNSCPDVRRLAIWSSFLVVLAATLTAGCGGEVTSPDPSTSGEVGATSPEDAVVYPGFACNAQQESWLRLNGENFTPLVVGVFEDGEQKVQWPTVEIKRVADLDGQSVQDGMTARIEKTSGKVVSGGGGTETKMGALGDAGVDGGTSDVAVADVAVSDAAASDTGGGSADVSSDAVGSDTVAADTGTSTDIGPDTSTPDVGVDTGPGTRDGGATQDGGTTEDAGTTQDTGTPSEDTGTRPSGDTGSVARDATGADAGPQRHLIWLDDTTIRFKITPDMNLEPGVYNVKVITSRVPNSENQNKSATAKKALGILPRPSVENVEEKPLCLEQSGRALELTGRHFMRRGDQTPTVVVADRTYQPGKDALSGCEKPQGPFGPYELCSSLTLDIKQGDLPPSSHDIEVQNFAPAACHSKPAEDESSVRVVPSPRLDAIRPDPICSKQTEYDPVTISGADFIEIGGDSGGKPSVSIGSYSPSSVTLEDCSPVDGNVPDGTSRCSTIKTSIPAGELPAESHAVEVSNPGASGCATRESVSLTSLAPPSITQIAPQPVINAQTDDRLTVTGERFAVVDGTLPTVEIGGGMNGSAKSYKPKSIEGCREVKGPAERRVNLCTRLEFEIPEGDFTVGGDRMTRRVSVVNPSPLGCESTLDQGPELTFIDEPELGAVEPDPICTADGSRVMTVSGTDFMVVDGETPTVSIGMHSYQTTTFDQSNCTSPNSSSAPPTVEYCEALQFEIPQGDLRNGNHPVTVYNPEPVGGYTETADVDVRVVDEPSISEIQPPLSCLADADQQFRLVGHNFIRKQTSSGMMTTWMAPSVTVANPSATVTEVTVPNPTENCTDIEGPSDTYQSCSVLEFKVQSTSDTGLADVSVQNPATAGCSSGTVSLRLDPKPTVASAVPDPQSSTCQKQNYRRIVVTGQKFLSVDGTLPTVQVGTNSYTPRAANNCSAVPNVDKSGRRYEYCKELIVYPSVADLQSSRTLKVENPPASEAVGQSGCVSSNSVQVQQCP